MLSAEALAFVAALQRAFGARRVELLGGGQSAAPRSRPAARSDFLLRHRGRAGRRLACRGGAGRPA